MIHSCTGKSNFLLNMMIENKDKIDLDELQILDIEGMCDKLAERLETFYNKTDGPIIIDYNEKCGHIYPDKILNFNKFISKKSDAWK